MSKYKKTRIVIFKEDFRITKGRVFKKDQKVAMHEDVVATLKKKNAKFSVETLDAEKIEARLKKGKMKAAAEQHKIELSA